MIMSAISRNLQAVHDQIATSARQATRRDIPVPPGLFKYFVVNNTGQAFAASGSLLEWRGHSIETA